MITNLFNTKTPSIPSFLAHCAGRALLAEGRGLGARAGYTQITPYIIWTEVCSLYNIVHVVYIFYWSYGNI